MRALPAALHVLAPLTKGALSIALPLQALVAAGASGSLEICQLLARGLEDLVAIHILPAAAAAGHSGLVVELIEDYAINPWRL